MNRKVLLALVAAVIALACAIGGTVAFLSDIASVTNTFVSGDIGLTLTETTGSEYKLIPGSKVPKNPTVSISHGSESAWIFVKVEEENNPGEYITYTLADGWTELASGVYYREHSFAVYDVTYQVLSDNSITVKDTITEEALASIRESGAYPNLSFTAYAVQREGIKSATEAWELIKNL